MVPGLRLNRDVPSLHLMHLPGLIYIWLHFSYKSIPADNHIEAPVCISRQNDAAYPSFKDMDMPGRSEVKISPSATRI